MATRISLLGDVGVAIAVGRVDAAGLGRLGRLAFAYLVAQSHRPVPREELADLLWGEAIPATWEASLRKLASRLRAFLASAGLPPGALSIERGAYRLRLPVDVSVDADDAMALAAAAEAALREGDVARARARAGEAAALLAGGLLPGETGDWVERRRAELLDVRLRALEVLADACAASGDPAAAAVAAAQAVELEPFRETATVRLMLALAAGGNRAEAVQAYERCRRLLREELGISPSAHTESAHRRVLLDQVAEATPEPGPAPRRAAVPTQVTSFVGRADELAAVRQALSSARLVTLTGPGGVGKTRLATELAAAVAGEFEAVAFVELASQSDPRVVPLAALAALGLRDDAGRSATEVLIGHLENRRGLLVLDNCEHLAGAAAELADALVRGCPDLRILATSREPLHVPGETVWRVPPLAAPPEDAPGVAALGEVAAVRLFSDRATSADPAFRLDEGNAGAVARICRRLDGLPLALELAAARIGAMSPVEIAQRLDLRFPLLSIGARTAPSRHQTLRAAIDWSYDALGTAERRLLERLSVFAGDFGLEAAEAVCAGGAVPAAELPGLLAGLVDKSLVTRVVGGAGGRYRLLETLRIYAAERLAREEGERGARQQLLTWSVSLAERADAALTGPGQAAWLDRLEAEHDNLRAALAWGAGRRDSDTLRLAAALGRFWEIRGHFSSGRMWLAAALDCTEETPLAVMARAVTSAAVLAQLQGDLRAAAPLFERALAAWRLAGDIRGTAGAINGLGGVAAVQGDLTGARSLYEECLALGQASGDAEISAAALTNLGRLAQQQADHAGARTLYEESLALYREAEDRRGVATVLGNLGFLAFETGDLEAARALAEESLGLRRELGDRHGVALLLGNLGHLALQGGDVARARTLYEESLAVRRELGDRVGIPGSLNNLSDVALAEGDHATACCLAEQALAIASELGDRHRMTLSLLQLAHVRRGSGDLDEAARLARRALAAARELGADGLAAESLEALTVTAAQLDRWETAAELAGAAAALREAIGGGRPPGGRAEQDRVLVRLRDRLGEAAFDAAWARGRAADRDWADRWP